MSEATVANAPRESSRFESQLHRFHEANMDYQDLVVKLRQIINHLSIPDTGVEDNSAVPPMRQGLLGALEDKIDVQFEINQEFRTLLDRLRGLVGVD